MSIDTSAKLLYGTPYSNLPEEILEEVDEMLDDGELDYASPYYDAPRDEWIVGVECEMKLPNLLKNCDVGFYVTPHVW